MTEQEEQELQACDGATPGPWTHAKSHGVKGHGFEAQVFDAEGNALLFFADGRSIGPEADANAALIALAPALLAEVRRLRAENADLRGSCPCLYTTPCQKHCTCVEGYSSHGCLRCCSYGSLEQRRQRAEWLAAADSRAKQAAEAERERCARIAEADARGRSDITYRARVARGIAAEIREGKGQ